MHIDEKKKSGMHRKQYIEKREDCTAADEIVSPLFDNLSPKPLADSVVITLIICLSAEIQAAVYSSLDSLIIFFLASIKSGILKIYFSNLGSIDMIDDTNCLQKIRGYLKILYLAYGLTLFSIASLVVSAINTEHALTFGQL